METPLRAMDVQQQTPAFNLKAFIRFRYCRPFEFTSTEYETRAWPGNTESQARFAREPGGICQPYPYTIWITKSSVVGSGRRVVSVIRSVLPLGCFFIRACKQSSSTMLFAGMETGIWDMAVILPRSPIPKRILLFSRAGQSLFMKYVDMWAGYNKL